MIDATHQMRTTLSLDDDVLAAARVLVRRSLAAPASITPASATTSRNGLPLLPLSRPGAPVDLVLVNSMRDDVP